jgi:hypothetical protein
MLEGIIALVVIGTIGYFMWQKSKNPTEKVEEPAAPYKVEPPVVVEPVAAPAPVITTESKPKAKRAVAPKAAAPKAKVAKPATEAKPKAVRKPKIKIAK